MKVDAILPAAGRLKGPLAERMETEVKALFTVGDRTMLGRTIESARRCGQVGRIVVIGPDEIASHPDTAGADRVLPEGASGPENILSGLEFLLAAGSPEKVLILTTDLPFLSPEMIASFLERCPPGADICMPAIDRASFDRRFPEAPREYVRLRDGQWTLGCAFLVDARALERSRARLTRAFAARKNQLAMARLLGPRFICRFLLGRLGIDDVVARCEEILQCPCAAVRECAPELAFDIDDEQDYAYAALHALADRACSEGR